MSGASTGAVQTSTSGIPQWLQDYGNTLAGAASSAAQTPYQPYYGPRVADLDPLQTQALQGAQSWNAAAAPYAGTVAASVAPMLSGSLNPFTQQAALPAIQQARDAYNQATSATSGRFNTAGNWGSARHGMADELNSRAFATALDNSIGGLYSNAYDQAQNRVLQGSNALQGLYNTGLAGMNQSAQLGNIGRLQQQQLIDSLYGDFQNQVNYPWTQVNNAANVLGALTGSAPRTQTSQTQYDPISQGLGLMALGGKLGSH